MPEEKERPRPHGDKLEDALHRNPEDNRAQSQSDATPEEIPPRGDLGDRDLRDTSDRARGRGSTANGVPEFDEDAGELRRQQYRQGADLVSGVD